MLPGTRKGTNSGRSSEEAGTNLSRSRRGAAAGGTGDEVTLNPHSYVLRESRINLEATTFSGFLIRFRDDYGIDKDFKKFMFKIEKIRNQLISQATDSANKNISQQVIANLDIAVSQRAEQRKVGLFFSTLDSLLSLHQRKPF